MAALGDDFKRLVTDIMCLFIYVFVADSERGLFMCFVGARVARVKRPVRGSDLGARYFRLRGTPCTTNTANGTVPQ